MSWGLESKKKRPLNSVLRFFRQGFRSYRCPATQRPGAGCQRNRYAGRKKYGKRRLNAAKDCRLEEHLWLYLACNIDILPALKDGVLRRWGDNNHSKNLAFYQHSSTSGTKRALLSAVLLSFQFAGGSSLKQSAIMKISGISSVGRAACTLNSLVVGSSPACRAN
jgi:hypothetical protein